ncbi:unnamed protein product [Phytomonas sp. Hart1]|nr:unnamed protein product [Phytomonas sp. Hart1]|eukprot:CCW68001.1 unnamed protein product [Phytomonas sp. isolate Hart1]
MKPTQRLYVQCNPLLDICANVDREFLQRYKIVENTSSLMSDEHLGIYDEIEKKDKVVYVPGGSGLNTARVAQWIAQAPKGTFVSYVGCIAKDRYGGILKDSAEGEGLTMILEYTTEAPTGTCAACIVGKERSLVANLGAASHLSPAHIEGPAVAEALKKNQLFYLTGFTLTIDVNYVLKVARASREVNGVFMMNLSALFIVQCFTDQLRKVLPYVDVLFGNEDEARSLAKLHGWDTEDVAEIARRAAVELPYDDHRDRLTVFTQGDKFTVFAMKSGRTGSVPVKRIDSQKIVDTNAAGDSFVGGFLAAYASGFEIERCCEVGNYAAGVVIQHSGCTFPEKPDLTF